MDDQQEERPELEPATRAELDQAIRDKLEARAVASGAVPEAAAQGAPVADIDAYARAQGLRVNAPARPELQPGESVTTVPDRYCERCEEPRGGRRCNACGAITVRAYEEPAEAPRYEHPPFVRRAAVREPVRAQRREAATMFPEEYEMPERIPMAAGTRAPRFAPPQREARPMNQRQQQRRQQLRAVDGDEQDEYGYPVYDTPSRRRRGGGGRRVRSAEDELASHWITGNVRLELWWMGFQALLQGCESVEDVSQAADLADAAYIEMMGRQR